MNRVHALGLVAVAATSLLLAACSSGGATPDEPVELTLWSTGDMQDQVDLYNETHPNVTVTLEIIPNQDYISKLTTAVAAGDGPDVAGVQYQDLPTVLTTGALADVSDYVPDGTSDKFVSWAWDQVAVGDAVYGIPIDSGPLGLYYRSDLFEQYGIPVPTTWEEFEAASAAVRAAAPDSYLTAFSPGDTTWFTALATQNGAHWFETEGDEWVVSLDGAESLEVADYWQGLIDGDLAKAEGYFSDGWNSDMQNGTVLTWISAAWGGGFLSSVAPDLGGKWSVAPLPTWDGEPRSANWGGSAATVTANSEHPQEATDLAIWLWSDPASVELSIVNHGIFPASLDGLESEALTTPIDYLDGQSLADVFVDASKSIDTSVQWGPTMSQVITDVGAGFGLAAEGSGTLADALAAAQTKTLEYMTSQGFSAKAG